MNSLRKPLLAAAYVAIFSLATVATYFYFRSDTLPSIQGVIIAEGRALEHFQLTTHKNKSFTNADLVGDWTIISYGYTDCPDICPTTLSQLVQIKKKLAALGKYDDINIVFYTVDPQRDTVDKLSEYIPFFNETFTGLTWNMSLESKHIPFEKSLGIVSAIEPLANDDDAKGDYKGYSVSHGVLLYLVNPAGKLQAILKPDVNIHGFHSFTVGSIYRDYVAIRAYYD